MKRVFLPVVLCLVASTVSGADAVTSPSGFTKLVIPGKVSSARAFKTISLNMMRPSVFQSLISGVSVNGSGETVIEFSGATFSAGQLEGDGKGHFLEIRNGAKAGTISDVVSASGTTVTLVDDISGAITIGQTTANIRPHWTLSTAFGSTNPFGFKAGSTSSQADAIQILNPLTGVLATYFYHATNQRWQVGGNSANNIEIPPDAGLLIERKLATQVEVILTGDVKTGPTALYVDGGAGIHSNLVSNPYPLDSKRLADSGLYTGNPATGVFPAVTSSGADTVGVLDPATGILTSYFYSSTNNRWQKGGNDASDDVIPNGVAVLITRKGGRGSFSWYAPQPAMNLAP